MPDDSTPEIEIRQYILQNALFDRFNPIYVLKKAFRNITARQIRNWVFLEPVLIMARRTGLHCCISVLKDLVRGKIRESPN